MGEGRGHGSPPLLLILLSFSHEKFCGRSVDDARWISWMLSGHRVPAAARAGTATIPKPQKM